MRHSPARDPVPVSARTARAAACAERLFRAALEAVEAERAVLDSASLAERALCGEPRPRRVIGLAIGKAARPMARAIAAICGERLDRGFALVNEGYATGEPAPGFDEHACGHPLPDARSVEATRLVLDELAKSGSDTVLLAGLSGGGSAALAAPAPGIPLEDKRALIARLLAAGAPIDELNAVRQHVSRVKGGRLARAAYPARTVAWVISDVPGDRLDLIASGPLSPAVATWRLVARVLSERLDGRAVPASIARRVSEGLAGRIDDLPRESDPAFAPVAPWIVARPQDALEAAARAAERDGLAVHREPSTLTGEPAGEGRRLAERLLSLERPACLLAAGELAGAPGLRPGRGGPCHEAALSAAEILAGHEGVVLLAADTDGIDGNAAGAGAIADGATLARACARGLDAREHAVRHDAATFFEHAGGALHTGATGTNVMQFFCGVALADRA